MIRMNVKRYLSIVGVATLVFAIFIAGIAAYKFLYTPFGVGVNMPDGSGYDNDVQGIDEVEKSKPYNILVLGVDVEASLTDVIMLCQIDTVNHRMNMLSIPRDTRISFNGRTMKINETYKHQADKNDSGSKGVEATIKAVKELTGLPVHYYFLVNTQAFRDSIDAVGGVDFDVPQNMNYDDPLQDLHIHLKKGYQHLDGDKSEQLVRFRRYANGDVDRIKVQQAYFKALVDQKLAAKYVLKIPEVYGIIEGNSATNMRGADMLSAGKNLLKIDKENFNTYTLPGLGQYVGEVSYYIHDQDEMESLINSTFAAGNTLQ